MESSGGGSRKCAQRKRGAIFRWNRGFVVELGWNLGELGLFSLPFGGGLHYIALLLTELRWLFQHIKKEAGQCQASSQIHVSLRAC